MAALNAPVALVSLGAKEKAAAAASLDFMAISAAAPGWSWRASDSSMLLSCILIGSIGSLVAFALLCFAFWQRSSESTPIIPKAGWHRWRVVALVGIGLSPLTSCLLVGESLDNVLFAMVAMHWVCMLTLPALYYAIVCRAQEGLNTEVASFYYSLWDAHAIGSHGFSQTGSFRKAFRGCILGIPTFLCLISGYLLFRCRTFTWGMCIRNFESPLEKYGFEQHSMPFRIFAAAYFTFWNPLIEELFWRVFLHREMSLELGLKAKSLAESGGEAPWSSILSELLELMPWNNKDASAIFCGVDVKVRWGVSLMYASYHTWPMAVLFQKLWAYTIPGFLLLACLGRFFVLLRESPDFGLPAVYTLHVWVDAAFALLCLFELHPWG